MILYSDYYSLFEKFSILTTDGKLTDNEALKYLRDKTTEDLFKELQKRLLEISIKK